MRGALFPTTARDGPASLEKPVRLSPAYRIGGGQPNDIEANGAVACAHPLAANEEAGSNVWLSSFGSSIFSISGIENKKRSRRQCAKAHKI